EPRPLLGDRLSRAAVGLTRRRAAGTADGRAYRRRAADPCRLHGGGNSAAAERERYLSFGRERELSEHGSMNGAEWLARALAGGGTTHVFFVESVLRRTLLHLKDLRVTPVLAHSEKAAAYMADGYARIAGRPGVCMAQAVGAANLASGLQDPFLGRSPVVALTGRKPPAFQHRNAYQEIPHAPLFAAVTKFSTTVDLTSELPRLLRHAWRAALAETPRPTHLDFSGHQGDEIELGQTAEPPVIDPEGRRIPAHRPIAPVAAIERAPAALSTPRPPSIAPPAR